MSSKARVYIYISGIVQGVFFRARTRNQAKRLGLFGWVRNLEDGRVEILAEGEKEKVKKLIEWVRKGPKFTKVESLDLRWEDYKGELEDFEIRYD